MRILKTIVKKMPDTEGLPNATSVFFMPPSSQGACASGKGACASSICSDLMRNSGGTTIKRCVKP